MEIRERSKSHTLFLTKMTMVLTPVRISQRLNCDAACKLLAYSASRPGEIVVSAAHRSNPDALRYKVKSTPGTHFHWQLIGNPSSLTLAHRT